MFLFTWDNKNLRSVCFFPNFYLTGADNYLFVTDVSLCQLRAADIYTCQLFSIGNRIYFSSCRQQRNRNHRVYYQFVEKNQNGDVNLCRLPTLRKRAAHTRSCCCKTREIFSSILAGRFARRSRIAGNGWLILKELLKCGFFLSSQQMKFWRLNQKFNINMVTGIICLYWISW